MKITPLVADSMGSRSMAVFVETKDENILIDPGASIAPLRFGLSPHPLEQWQLQKHVDRIRLFAESSQAVLISSYHSDHFLAGHPEWMKNKILFLKNPNQNTTPNERKSAFHFLKAVNSMARELHFADDHSFSFGKTELLVSPPCFNGLEYFIQVLIRSEGKAFLFSSGVQGFVSDATAEFMLRQKAEFLYLDGPVTYLQKSATKTDALAQSLERMRNIVLKTGARRIILDHHLMRDVHWKKHVEPFLKFGLEHGVKIQTAAEFRGEETTLLEARRSLLYQNQPQK